MVDDSHIPAPAKAVELAQKALAANQALQQELAQRAERLQLEILEADRLVDALENGTDLEDVEDEIQIAGARRAVSLFPLSECLNEESPFYEEATKRANFAARITPQSFNPKQLEALKTAVQSENQRLQACRKQAGNHELLDLDRNVEGINWTVVAEKVSDASSDTFTAEQCRIKWIGSKHPNINQSDWSKTETKDLLTLLESKDKDAAINWVEVAEELGTNRAPMDVMTHGRAQTRHQWDARADQRLLEAIEKYGTNNWTPVARAVSPHATPTQCQSRYTKSLDPSIKRGAWTPAEDGRLTQAVRAVGSSSWVRVAEYVPNRTNDQCNERWTGALNAAPGKNVWTPEEDARLLELVGELGRGWKVISERIGGGKTGPSCRLRYAKLSKATANAVASGSGLVALSPAPGTASAMSSQPPETPREASVHTEHSGMAQEETNTESTTATVTEKAKGKKRARVTPDDEEPPPSKKKKAAQKTAAQTQTPSVAEETASSSTQDATQSGVAAKPRPKPRPRKKASGANGNDAATNEAAPSTTDTVKSPSRRSARVSARSAGGS